MIAARPTADAGTLTSLVDLAMRRKGRDLLFADEHERYTGDEARVAVAQIGNGLVELGARQGDRVAFMATSSVRHALSFFACHRLGIIPCALHLREPLARLAEALKWLEADMVICDAEHEDLAGSALSAAARGVPVLGLGDAPASLAEAAVGEFLVGDDVVPDLTSVHVREDDLAMIILSSGTTGSPKGTLNLQRTLYATAMAGAPVFGAIGSGDALVVAVAPSAAAWIHMVLPFVAVSASVHFMRRFEAAAYVETLGRERITHAPIVPTMWRMALAAVEEDHSDLPWLRVAFFAGEVGSADLVAEMKRKLPGARLRTAYLSAEGGCASACVADESVLIDAQKASSAGRPIRGCELRVVALDGSIDDELPAGEEGEIVLRSASIAAGYWKAEELVQLRFINGWWRSGDIGYVDDQGDLFIVGRTDHVINSGGIKIHAEEVEAALMQHPAVTLAAVVPARDKRWGQAVVAHVVLSDPSTTADEIIAFCRDRQLLASVKLPKKLVFHERLPMGPTGKLYRRGLATGDSVDS
jgi:acyl-CoA synthetase (AMP-forming)/AMP-acid ligase II